MKRTHTQRPVIPKGWTGKNFNNWAKYIHAQVSKKIIKQHS